jgi:hypothetical protein
MRNFGVSAYTATRCLEHRSQGRKKGQNPARAKPLTPANESEVSADGRRLQDRRLRQHWLRRAPSSRSAQPSGSSQTGAMLLSWALYPVLDLR